MKMNQFLIGTLVLGALTTGAMAQNHHAGHGASNSALTDRDTGTLKGLLEKNDGLFNALLARDPKVISAKAKDLKIYLHSRGHSKAFHNLHEQLGKLDVIGAYKDQKTALDSYAVFVAPLIELIKTHRPGHGYNVFTCPMVKKSWIQDTSKQSQVRNVYAQEMLECGDKVTNF